MSREAQAYWLIGFLIVCFLAAAWVDGHTEGLT